MSDDTLTLRQHLEVIREQHSRAVYRMGLCRCGEDYPCSNREHADAALAILDATERADFLRASDAQARQVRKKA